MEDFPNTNNETRKHILSVCENINKYIHDLLNRGINHDASKLNYNQASVFDKCIGRLHNAEYNSEEYKQLLKELQPALIHHYKLNDHHPEHFDNGIQDMNMLQLLEMLADWKASCSRVKDGDIIKSIEINQNRFNYSDDIKSLLINTVKYMNWDNKNENI